MPDLNVPHEVLDETAHAISNVQYPNIAWTMVNGHSLRLRMNQARAAARILVHWAREEALKEAEAAVTAAAPYNIELRHDGSEDPQAAVWVDGIRTSVAVIQELRKK